WLRWWDQTGNLLPWALELIEQERQQAEKERQRAEQERQEKERLIAYLRSQGIDPHNLPNYGEEPYLHNQFCGQIYLPYVQLNPVGIGLAFP
ncbi:MAG: hypothetical protein ACKPEQ_15620, partial [Dolichospermum sp.]